MQVPSLNLSSSSSAKECQYSIPLGVFKRKDSQNFSLKIELCSFLVSDNSKIKKISIWHCFTKQLGVLGTDILILEGDEIHAKNGLDHLDFSTRCVGDNKKSGITYFLDSKHKADLPVTHILLKIHELYPSWISKKSLEEIIPKFEAFINIPSIRGLKKMQFEAKNLSDSYCEKTPFTDFLSLLFMNTLQFENCSLSQLKHLVTYVIKDLKDKMRSPRSLQISELTDPCTFLQENEERLIKQIKRVARKRIFWGHDLDDVYFTNNPLSKRLGIFNHLGNNDIIRLIVADDI